MRVSGREKTANGRQQTAKTSCTLGYKRYREKAWKTTKELDRHRTRFERHQHDLRSTTTARCQQRRLASMCGPSVSLTRDGLMNNISTLHIAIFTRFSLPFSNSSSETAPEICTKFCSLRRQPLTSPTLSM